MIKVNKHKGKRYGFKGRIKAVLSRKVKVTMLEGPEKGATNGFAPKCLTLVAEAESPKPLFAKSEAPKTDPEEASEAPPQKKQKTQAEEWADAAEILGLA